MSHRRKPVEFEGPVNQLKGQWEPCPSLWFSCSDNVHGDFGENRTFLVISQWMWKKVLHQSLGHTTRFWCADSNYWGFSWSWFSLIGWDCDRSKSGREWNCRSNNWWCDCGSVSLAISLWLLQWVQTWLQQWVQAVAALQCGWCGELFPSEQTLKIHIEVRAHQRGGERVQESTSQPLPPRRGKEQKWFNQATSNRLSRTRLINSLGVSLLYELPP